MEAYTVLAAFYDRLNAHVDYPAIRDFLLSVFEAQGIPPGATLLDLACGTGRLTNLFAEAGYDMIAADLSPDMLAIAREESEKRGLSPLYLCQDMRALDLYGTVDAAFSFLDSLNYLSSAADLDALFGRLKHFIAPGGLFVFDVNTRFKFEEVYRDHAYIFDEKDVFCAWQNHYMPRRRVCDFYLTFFVRDAKGDYRRFEETQRETYFSDRTIERAFSAHGFEKLAVYGNTDRSPVSDTDERRYFVLQRKIL